MAAENINDSDKRKNLRKIINDASVAFMVTHAGESLHGRPMATAKVEESFNAIWFATQRHSEKVREIKKDDHVYLGYTNSSGSEYASINGRVRTVDDREKIHELWSPAWKLFFEGPDDPNLILLCVTPEHGEYWDSGSRIVSAVKFAVGAITGAKLNPGENADVTLR